MKETQLLQDLKNTTIIQLYARAEAPCRDYYGLTVAEKYICMNIWRVTYGRNAFPKRIISDTEDMKADKFFQEEIRKVFGENIYDFVMTVTHEKKTLGTLPNKIFLKIMSYLNRNDIFSLSRTSKIFNELCNTDTVWFLLFRKVFGRMPSPFEKKIALELGWREALLSRITHIKKIHNEKNIKRSVKPGIVTVRKTVKAK